MSSHHFVKEGQEPALWIHQVPKNEAWMQYLEWQPRVIAEAGTLERLHSWGIKVDEVWGNREEFFELEKILHEQQPIQIHDKKGKSFFQILDGLGFKWLYLILTESQLDPGFLNELIQLKTELILINESERMIPIQDGFTKWFPKGALLKTDARVHPLTRVKKTQGGYEIQQEGLIQFKMQKKSWLREKI